MEKWQNLLSIWLQEDKKEVITGQSLYKEDLLRGRVSKWNGWSVRYPCTVIVQKEAKNHLHEKLVQEQKN